MFNRGKPPKQARSKQTVDDILDATAQLLDRPDGDRLTTNEVAERAGFSIGTLYRYFSNKSAIIRALGKRELDRLEQRINTGLANMDTFSVDAAIRVYVQAFVTPFKGSLTIRRRAMRVIGNNDDLRAEGSATLRRVFTKLEELMIEHDPERYSPLTEAEFAILRGSMFGSTRWTIFEEPELLTTDEFEDTLVEMIEWFFLKKEFRSTGSTA